MHLTMVVFDLGNVLVDWDPVLTQQGSATPQQWQEFVERTDFWALNRTLDAGAEIAPAREAFAAAHGEDVAYLDRYVQHFPASLRGPVPGMTELVEDLERAGLRLGGLSNWSRELYHHASEGIELVGHLEDVVVSGFEGVAKPDPRIYRIMLQRFHTTADQTLFVDDMEVNVQAARGLGMLAHQFTDAQELRAWMGRRGIL
ncbi:MAG: HAD family phosphatase [Actinomyces sp.]|nr:HAD family phosphatase [Actinomyces sp.]MDN6428418.1 HAD family phosphatase [Propionibacterium sp.]MDN6566273.1 HAD family phosphatase [Actinomyces sp.]